MTQGDITIPEGTDAVFGIEITGAAAASTLTLTLADGTALDADYFDSANAGYYQYSTDGGTNWADVSGAITLAEGDNALQVKTDTIDDTADEADETFTLTGTLSSNGTDYSDTSTATIQDNDAPTITLGNPSDMTQGDITVSYTHLTLPTICSV